MVRRSVLPTVALASLSAAVAASFRALFDTGGWVAPVLGAALVPHAIGLLTQRRHVGTALVASALGLVAFVTWGLGLPAAGGLPSPRTWEVLVQRLSDGWHVLRTETTPVAARPGVLFLAVLTLWTMATVAHALATRVGATLGALGPPITVFIWVAALSGEHADVGMAVVVCIAASAFLAAQHRAHTAGHRAVLGPPGRRTKLAGAAAAVTVTGALAIVAGVVAPLLPGAEARAPLDLGSHDGARHEYQTTIAPLADVTDKLRQREEVELFTVRSPTRDYWRLTALDDYRARTGGGQWTLRASGGAIAEGLHGPVPADAYVQVFRIGPLGERWMPAAYRPVRVRGANALVVRTSRTLVTTARSVAGAQYRVASAPSVLAVDDARRLRTAKPIPRALRPYVRLPHETPPIVRTLAAELTADAATPFDKAKALRDFFRSGSFTYDPTVDLDDSFDATVDFLRTRRGFCVQFASTYALMARAVGIPTRVAVGFTSGVYDEVRGSYRVTNHDAHAWPEIWLAGLGWTHMFDPTPASALPGGSDLPGDTAPEQTGGTQAGSAAAPVVPETQQPAEPAPGAPAPAAPAGRAPRAHASGGVPVIPWVLAAVILGSLAAPTSVLTIKARRRSRRRRAGAAAQVVGAWEEAVDRLVEAGTRTRPSETAHELAARSAVLVGPAGARLLTRLADLAAQARFSPAPVSDVDAERAWKTLQDLEAALRCRFGWGARWRARMTIAPRRVALHQARQARSTVMSSSTKD